MPTYTGTARHDGPGGGGIKKHHHLQCSGECLQDRRGMAPFSGTSYHDGPAVGIDNPLHFSSAHLQDGCGTAVCTGTAVRDGPGGGGERCHQLQFIRERLRNGNVH